MRLRIAAFAGLGLLAGVAGCAYDDGYAYDGRPYAYDSRPYTYDSYGRPARVQTYAYYDRPYYDRYYYPSHVSRTQWDYQRQAWAPSRWDSSPYDAYRRGYDRP